MFTIKMYRSSPNAKADGIRDSEYVSCHRYAKVFLPDGRVQIVPRGMNDLQEGIGFPAYHIGPQYPNEDDRVPYRFDQAFVENEVGKTVDRIGPIQLRHEGVIKTHG